MKKNKSENIPVDFSILNDMPTDFKIDRITREAGFQMKTSHVHPFYDITYLINGECTCFVNHSIYKLSKGDLIIIPPGDIQKYLSRKDTGGAVCVKLPRGGIKLDTKSYWR